MSVEITEYTQGYYKSDNVTVDEIAWFDGTLCAVLSKTYSSYGTDWKAVVSIDKLISAGFGQEEGSNGKRPERLHVLDDEELLAVRLQERAQVAKEMREQPHHSRPKNWEEAAAFIEAMT